MASDQAEEITTLKSVFEDQVKVITNIGDFTHVVTFHPKDLDLQCKFQLLGDYPNTSPTIIIRSQQMTAEQIQDMTSNLDETAKMKLGTNMLGELINQCLQIVKDEELDLTQQVVKQKSKSTNPKSKNKKQKAPKSELEAEPKGKKPPMKTAAEVIKRLQWDEAVNKEDFIVGYMDRLTGLEEKPFTDFTWEDLATVDPYCLAIPQHRIQYFKYIDEKVWDKNERLDNVFGSTGSKLTLPEAIQKYHDSKQSHENTEGNEQLDLQENNTNVQEEISTERLDIDTADLPANKGEYNDKGEDTTGAILEVTPRKNRGFNYFIALQITNKTLIDKLVNVQKQIAQDNPIFKDFVIPHQLFHLTLNAMKLSSDQDIVYCVSTLKKMQYDLLKLTKAAGRLEFDGLGHFSNRVIFAKTKFNQGFQELVDTIKYNLAMADIENEVQISYTPHLTLFKMGWNEMNDLRRSGVQMRVNLGNSEQMLGHQSVDNVSLCAMGGRADDGFYRKAYEFKLSDFDFEL